MEAYSCVIYARATAGECEEGGSDSDCNLLFAKTRVAPLEGSTIAKLELQGLLQLSRSILKLVTALEKPVERVVLAGDSLCSLMAIRRPGVSYNPYFQNRVSEIQRNLQALQSRVGLLEDTAKVPGEYNPADEGTRPGVTAASLRGNSLWLKGPHFLTLPREDWPLDVPEDMPGAIPALALRKGMSWQQVFTTQEQDGHGVSDAMETILDKFSSLTKAQAVMVRTLRLMLRRGPDTPRVGALITAREVQAVWKLFLHQQQATVRQKWSQGKLSGLPMWISSSREHHQGLLVTRGRLPSRAWERLSGMPYLPVLLGSSRLAYLLIKHLHEMDHRQEIGAVLAASRRWAWITAGRRLVRTVVKSCMACRRFETRRQSQRMGPLSEAALGKVRPFQIVGLDLMGPMKAGVGAGRKKVAKKHWVSVYVCLSTRAVATWVLEGYSARDFLEGHRAHTAVYGHPTSITTN